MDGADPAYRMLLRAVAFAARAHRGQLRKDGATPYASHVFRACLTARCVFGVEDPAVLTAAVLHDAIEDTTTDFDDLAEQFGPVVAGWVALLSKDKRLPDPIREEKYQAALAGAPWQVKLCKLADVYDNLLDSEHLGPERRARTFRRCREYLDALEQGTPREEATRALAVVRGLLAELEAAMR
jgi:guanosine-3',5'-bis(diphosphate) 3'-pyrophosphohydrolase